MQVIDTLFTSFSSHPNFQITILLTYDTFSWVLYCVQNLDTIFKQHHWVKEMAFVMKKTEKSKDTYQRSIILLTKAVGLPRTIVASLDSVLFSKFFKFFGITFWNKEPRIVTKNTQSDQRS